MEDWRQKAYLFVILGGVVYVILSSLGMLFYAGGTYSNPGAPGYSFWANYLSDIGRTKAYSGKDNTISMILYSLALSIWAISFFPFFIALRSLFTEGKVEKILSTIGSILGMIAAIGLIGIAFTPADILGGPHMISVFIGYSSLLYLAIIYSITLYRSNKFPNQYAIIFILWTIIFFMTLFMAIIGVAGIISQKIGRYTTIICFAYIGYGAWKLEKT